MRNNLSKSPPPNNMQSSRNEATIINDDLGSEDAQDTCINDGQVPVETKEAQIGRIRATFGILDCNKDKKLDANDLSKVLRKLRAPKEYLDSGKHCCYYFKSTRAVASGCHDLGGV